VSGRPALFVKTTLGAGLLAVAEFWILGFAINLVDEPNTFLLFLAGLLLAGGQAAWFAAPRLGAATAWWAAVVAAMAYILILVIVFFALLSTVSPDHFS
jgi:hypothetical protein